MAQHALTDFRNWTASQRRFPPSRGIFEGGVLSGLIGGAAMGLFAILHAAATGLGPGMPARMVSASLLGVGALLGGPGIQLLGLSLHVVIAGFWGVLFASLVGDEDEARAALMEGVLFAVGVWALMTFAFLPAVDPVMAARVALAPGAWFFEHLLYGACLASTPALKRRFAVRMAVRRHERGRHGISRV